MKITYLKTIAFIGLLFILTLIKLKADQGDLNSNLEKLFESYQVTNGDFLIKTKDRGNKYLLLIDNNQSNPQLVSYNETVRLPMNFKSAEFVNRGQSVRFEVVDEVSRTYAMIIRADLRSHGDEIYQTYAFFRFNDADIQEITDISSIKSFEKVTNLIGHSNKLKSSGLIVVKKETPTNKMSVIICSFMAVIVFLMTIFVILKKYDLSRR